MIDGLPYRKLFNYEDRFSFNVAQSLPGFPLHSPPIFIANDVDYRCDFDLEYENAFPAAVLELLRPSLWTFSFQFENNEVFSAEVLSGQRSDNGVTSGTDWTESLWNGSNIFGVGIASVIQTVPEFGAIADAELRGAVGTPVPYVDEDGQFWRLSFDARANDLQIPVKYREETFFDFGGDYLLEITRSLIED